MSTSLNRTRLIAALLALSGTAQAGAPANLVDLFIPSAGKGLMAETVVVLPGHRMVIAGKSVAVFGNQPCPIAERYTFERPGSSKRAFGCMIVDKGTAVVPAQFVLDGKKVTELWTVVRQSPSTTLLRRPNGELVVQAE